MESGIVFHNQVSVMHNSSTALTLARLKDSRLVGVMCIMFLVLLWLKSSIWGDLLLIITGVFDELTPAFSLFSLDYLVLKTGLIYQLYKSLISL